MANPLEWENKNALLVQGSVAVSNEVKTAPCGVPKWVIDSAPDDSNKEIVVPAGKKWKVELVGLIVDTSAVVGNRVMALNFMNGAVNLCRISPGFNQGAGTKWYYYYYPTAPLDTIGALVSAPTPSVTLLAGMSIKVEDGAIIDVAGDDMTVVVHVIEYDA